MDFVNGKDDIPPELRPKNGIIPLTNLLSKEILDSIAVWIDGGDEAKQSQVLARKPTGTLVADVAGCCWGGSSGDTGRIHEII